MLPRKHRVYSSLLLVLVFASYATAGTPNALPPRYREWLEKDVGYIITAEEKQAFLKLASDNDRDNFIARFWEVRNPTPGAPSNPYKEEHYRRLAYAEQYLGMESHDPGWRTDRGRAYITLGEPQQKALYYGYNKLRRMEIWFYQNAHPALPPYFYIVFYQRDDNGPFRFYSPYMDGPDRLVTTDPGSRAQSLRVIEQQAGREVARTALSLLPDEPVDLDSATSTLQSDILLSTIRTLANNPFTKQRLEQNRRLLEGVTHRVILGQEFVKVMTIPMRGPDGEVRVHYVLRLLRPEDFAVGQAKDGRLYYAAELTARVSDANNKEIFTHQEAVSKYFNEAEYEQIKNKSFAYEGTLPLTPGKYNVEFTLTNKLRNSAVRAQSQVVVPEPPKAGLLIPGMMPFSEAEDAGGPSALVPFGGGGVRFAPMVARDIEFVPGQDLKVVYQIWAPASDPRAAAGKRLRVEYAYGRFGIAGASQKLIDDVDRGQFDPFGSMMNGKKISLAEAKPGHYRLVVTVSDPETNQKAFTSMNFDVVLNRSEKSQEQTWHVFDQSASARLDEEARERALCLLANNDENGAVRWLATALERNPANARALARLVDFYFARHELPQIASLYPRVKITPQTGEQTVLRIAESLQKTGQLAKAVQLLETAVGEKPESGPLLLALASCYRDSGQAAKAQDAERKGRSLVAASNSPS